MTIVFCDVDGVRADAEAVEALARLQLVARRAGCDLRLRNASPELRDLVAFMGLERRPARAGDGYAASRRGRPNSGKIVSVPRKNVNSAMRPSTMCSTCSAHGS